MKIMIKNWYGFQHDIVNKKFEGDLTYINSFCIGNEYHPVAVYKAKKPNKSKGHKKYMLLQTTEQGYGLVRGMSPNQMSKERWVSALHCLLCDEVIFSAMRHDFCECVCKKSFVDGGKDYFRYGGIMFKLVKLDLISGKVKNV